MDYTDYLKCRILPHFLAKFDARKSDDSNRGGASQVSYFTAFSRELDAFYTSPSTSPACPTNIPSITNKSCDGVEEMMIQVGGHVNPYKKMNKK